MHPSEHLFANVFFFLAFCLLFIHSCHISFTFVQVYFVKHRKVVAFIEEKKTSPMDIMDVIYCTVCLMRWMYSGML